MNPLPSARSQERAPTSVAYAETQSMFLDSLAGDAAWLGRYARNGCAWCLPCVPAVAASAAACSVCCCVLPRHVTRPPACAPLAHPVVPARLPCNPSWCSEGAVLPWSIVEEKINSTQPFEVFA